MKFTLTAAVIVVLALAHGSLAQELTDLERLSQMFEDAKNTMTQQFTELIRNHNLDEHAQTVQEQLKSVATNIESQLKPMADDVQTNLQPMLDKFQKQVESIFQTLTAQARAIGN